MAGRRGRAKSFDEQILVLEEKIANLKGKLSELEAARAELMKQREEQEIKALYQCMTDKGLSVEDMYGLLEKADGQMSGQTDEETEQIA